MYVLLVNMNEEREYYCQKTYKNFLFRHIKVSFLPETFANSIVGFLTWLFEVSWSVM